MPDPKDLADFDKAVENNGKFDNPNRPFIWFNRGTYLMVQKNYPAAIADFTAAIEHGYREAGAFNKRAYCYLEQQQFKEALNDYRAVLKTHPTDTIALHGEADALQRAEVAGGDHAPSAVSK